MLSRRIRASWCAIVAAILLLAGFSASAQDSGLVLLHRMQRALGGADEIAAIHDLDWTIRAETFHHNGKPIGQVTKRTRWIRPNYLRLDQVGPGDTYVLYFDGTSGWEILPDNKRVLDLAGSELEFAREYLFGFQLNLWTADRAGGYTVTSPAANVIRFSANGYSDDITLDPRTWLPAEILEWTTVQGVRFPAHQLHSHKDDGSADMRTQTVKFNSGLDPRVLAAKPPDMRPAIVSQ